MKLFFKYWLESYVSNDVVVNVKDSHINFVKIKIRDRNWLRIFLLKNLYETLNIIKEFYNLYISVKLITIFTYHGKEEI